ncbi:MAG: isoprenylcysteine carboxylmethyltransferase family protein [Geobacteraceae bacterium]|nr:isoprenylcysteine carboxylmethyltransferase family protein [Geobacteraceae bacterium]
MNVFGIGPRIAATGITSFVAVILTGVARGPLVQWPFPREVGTGAGAFLAAVGFYFWLDSARLIATRFKRNVLITEGVYRLVRNPMYAAFIVFIVPGLSLVLDDPLINLSSVVMLLVFKLGIHREEEFLLERFGDEYVDYMRRVRQIVPFLW